jgi:hypothetical protein
MMTTTHATAPRFLLNVENGDYATLITRDCGCLLHKVGFTQHIHSVRSFEKMTGEGMNYAAGDLFDLLETQIPSEFGGGAGDYQLVEEEDERGQTRLTLLVHPDIGDLDDGKLLLRLQAGLAQGSRNHRFITKSGRTPAHLEFDEDSPIPAPAERHRCSISSRRTEGLFTFGGKEHVMLSAVESCTNTHGYFGFLDNGFHSR